MFLLHTLIGDSIFFFDEIENVEWKYYDSSSDISKLQACIRISMMLNDTSGRRENVEKDSLDENRFVIYFNYVLVYGDPFFNVCPRKWTIQ